MFRMQSHWSVEYRVLHSSTYLRVVAPRHGGRRVRGMLHDTRQVDCAPLIDEKLRAPEDLRFRLCEKKMASA